MQGPCETGETFGVCTSLYKNWKCRTSTKGTKVPPGHPPLPLYHPPVRNEELRLYWLTAVRMAKRGWSVLAHLACRTLLSVSLSPIPVTGSPALSGLVSFLPCDDWHLSKAPSIAWTRRVIQFVQRHWSLAMCSLFLLLASSLAMILLSRTSHARVQLRCFSACENL